MNTIKIGVFAVLYFYRVILLNTLVLFFEASFINKHIHLDNQVSFQNITCNQLSGCTSWFYWVRFQTAKYSESFLKNEVVEGRVNEYFVDSTDKDFSAPFVIRNAAISIAKEWGGLERGSYDKAFKYLTKRFGDKEVIVGRNRSSTQKYDSFDAYFIRLKQFLENMQRNTSFVDYVSLYDSFSAEYIDEMYVYLQHINRTKIVSSQIFLGANGTVSSYHNALFDNMFVQVIGTKKWCFIESQNWVHMRYVPYLSTRNFVSNIPPTQVKLIPRKCVFLKAGDILFNPSYMWHHVENKERLNLGFANRLPSHIKNYIFDTVFWKNIYAMNIYNPENTSIGKSILQELVCGNSKEGCEIDDLT